MMFLQVVTFAIVCLLLLSVSNVFGRDLYFGLMIGEHNEGGAKMGVDHALRRMNLLPSRYTLNYIELQVFIASIKIFAVCLKFYLIG